MLRRFAAIIAPIVLATAPAAAAVVIDASAARATLEALGRPGLSRAEALRVADLPANRDMIRKVNSLGSEATREDFADALVAAAHGEAKPSAFGFGRVRDGRAVTLALIDRIEGDPAIFRDWVAARVARFTPAGVDVRATGYIIAGGQADGFSFGDPAFYVDASRLGGDLEGARLLIAHELYHAVQNAAQARAPKGTVFYFENETYAALPPGSPRDCYATRAFFGSLLAEGTATYVGDPALLPATGAYSAAERARRKRITSELSSERTLLDMSLASITGPDPLPVDDVYGVGFYTPAPLYDLGYVMAKAIAERDGDAALGAFLLRPGDAFVQRYVEIAGEPGSKLPALGPRAVRWAGRKDCPAS